MNKEDLLKIFKNKNNRLICLILIIGVVLMAVASVDKNKKADVQPTAAVTSVEDEEKRLATGNSYKYHKRCRYYLLLLQNHFILPPS